MESSERRRRARLRAALRTALVALPIAACTAGPPTATPYVRQVERFLAPIGSLCMLPLRSEVDDPARVARFAAMLVLSLRGRGYEVVGPTETTATLDRIRREEGAVYDIYTGERLDGADAVSLRVRQRLGEELGCQALVSPRIVQVVAHWMAERGLFSEGTASWDGLRVDLEAGRNATGTIGAISLQIRLADLAGRELLYGAGGIRTTSVMVEGFATTRFDPIEPTRLLDNDDFNREAIRIALADLPRRKGASVPPAPRPARDGR